MLRASQIKIRPRILLEVMNSSHAQRADILAMSLRKTRVRDTHYI